MSEEWRDIASCPGYQASSLGRIRSLDRQIHRKDGRQRFSRGRVLRFSLADRYGRLYPFVNVPPRGPTKVHLLVLEAFEGPHPADLPFGLHRDDDPLNNRPANLYWGSQPDNSQDMVANGNHNNARKTHCKNGHPYTPENTRVRTLPNGRSRRDCVICVRESGKRTKERTRRRRGVQPRWPNGRPHKEAAA